MRVMVDVMMSNAVTLDVVPFPMTTFGAWPFGLLSF